MSAGQQTQTVAGPPRVALDARVSCSENQSTLDHQAERLVG
jgi:hypothetical protein